MYSSSTIEKKWQKLWSDQKAFNIQNKDITNKYYVLEMFPYPSGELHVGHGRNYILGDIVARYKRAKGLQVLHPIGWDAFGLPAENAARKYNLHPAKWTYDNASKMKKPLQAMGLSYDWSREIYSCDKKYYGYEQKLFLALYKKGLIYRKYSPVNWDPVEQTVLANEQVIDGKGWRSGAKIEKKFLPQWFCKITEYSEELFEDIPKLDGWPEKVKNMQKNWIDKKNGCTINLCTINQKINIEIFTTRQETIFGATFCAIGMNHPLIKELNNEKINDFVKENINTSLKQEITGVHTGIYLQHPILDKEIPVYAVNYVLSDYATGAVLGVPAHDIRDAEFAKKYDISLQKVIDEDNIICNSDFLNGLEVLQARTKITEYLQTRKIAKNKTFYRLKDWCISRQRYWGAPIPMIHCSQCGIIPVNEKDLPIELPEDIDISKKDNYLNYSHWKNIHCYKCKNMAQRETDTLDTFFESSWYFLRFCSDNENNPIEGNEIWMPVDLYIGGIEHAILHLLYARFFTLALRDLKLINHTHPFKRLFTQGMLCHESYQDKNKEWLYPEEVYFDGTIARKKSDNTIVKVGPAEKMSKSKFNLIKIEDISETYGIDAMRLFLVSDSPPEKNIVWSSNGINGCRKFLNRIWNVFINHENILTSQIHNIDIKNQKIIQLVQEMEIHIENLHINKYISNLYKMIDIMEKYTEKDGKKIFEIFLQFLAPIAPHISEELWHKYFKNEFIHLTNIPTLKLQKKETNQLKVYVNNKFYMNIENDASEEETIKVCEKNISNLKYRKVVYIPNRLIKFVQ